MRAMQMMLAAATAFAISASSGGYRSARPAYGERGVSKLRAKRKARTKITKASRRRNRK